tara:strand:+ start:7669 stop:8574 length:906 start_codon:yes stop_codon:yes gene_type:complete
MKIIISGAFGHIGSFLIEKFQKNKKIKSILLIDNFYTQRFSSYLKLKKNKIKLIDKDLNNFNLNNIKGKYDLFIHLSAVTNASESFKIKDFVYSNNLGGTKKVVEFCKKRNLRLIFPSSTSVYGKKYEIINSSNNMNNLFAQSPYAKCKIEEEKYIRRKLKNYVILRLGTIVGVSNGMRFHTAVNKFCYQSSLNQPLTIWKKFYKKKRPYLNLRDCYSAINFVTNKKTLRNETLDVVTENYTVEEIVKMISNKIKVKKKFVNTKILNQNSYEVVSDKLIEHGLKFSENIQVDINKTLKLFS